jgi:hypothetical protein
MDSFGEGATRGRISQEGRRLTLRVRCADLLAASAEWLLGAVASFAGRGKGLADGVIVQVGWSLLQLRRDAGELAVCEPNFDTDPFQDFRDDVTCTLTVLARQNLVHERLGIEGAPVRYDDKVVLKKGCLSAKRVYAQRQAPGDGDSGWYVGPVDDPGGPPDADDWRRGTSFSSLARGPASSTSWRYPKGMWSYSMGRGSTQYWIQTTTMFGVRTSRISAEQIAAADRGRIPVFHGTMSSQRPRLLSCVDYEAVGKSTHNQNLFPVSDTSQ